MEKSGTWPMEICLVPLWSYGNEDLIADQMADVLLAYCNGAVLIYTS